jgi:hypothetical protein
VADVRVAGKAHEHASGAASRLDALLQWDTLPWCSTWF